MNKEDLLFNLKEIVQSKIIELEQLIADLRRSNNETKSSMGDKYETGREMLAQQINHLQNQLKVQLELQNSLAKISTESSTKISQGALVQTDKAWFYISVGLGQMDWNQSSIYAVSVDAPLVKAMWNLSVNDEFQFNGVKQKILKII